MTDIQLDFVKKEITKEISHVARLANCFNDEVTATIWDMFRHGILKH